ncbi:MAG: hypothetical protein V7L01_34435 [Nostoc sp.]|uniref:hypothetical protein n=1 Tax=Nostoc sp. TaxID=1180 RepID=UPI002FF472EA
MSSTIELYLPLLVSRTAIAQIDTLPKILYVFLSKVWLQSQKQMWLKQLLPFIELNGGALSLF